MKYFLTCLIIILTSDIQITTDVDTYLDKRDNNVYEVVTIGGLNWFKENLRFKTTETLCVSEDSATCYICGQSYNVNAAFKACPKGWRLPTEEEVGDLIKLHKKGEIDIIKILNVTLCGRIDDGKVSHQDIQATFWMNSELKEGHIAHWHLFSTEQAIHTHNIVQAKRQFPVRCVCEIGE